MARNKVEIPTDDALTKAERALSALAAKKPETATDKIWVRLGDMITATRKSGHSWDDIAAALAASGITVSASTLRSSAPKTGKPRKVRAKQTGTGSAEKNSGEPSQPEGGKPDNFSFNPKPNKEDLL
ncbi:hypothetical protein [Xanthomonas hortorum]|uniref:hypothetical protein n=1 Tax=Xanthomonas hortorum TaxID=56454 RepID=UPI0015D622AA|nr:hypothetical protein [Xanthomonas hortorum]MCE4360536.1 hypothetical protein [Xanthomonas hortorum pv. taraxaci]NMI54070.1 hypothetical protein [Xanthomonas hortorum pv. taraxaci]CAD0362219.1 hypothetical protein NCPPB940_44430 [Xanthomonas hortorum pv. taraxaci]CAD0362225.1 hypothetical protein NCPPB940_44430 [Xanthomonas hortorum pv. taraxaci]